MYFQSDDVLCAVSVQRAATSVVRTAVARPATTSTPAIVLRTAWPEETAAPTTRVSVEVCSFRFLLSLYRFFRFLFFIYFLLNGYSSFLFWVCFYFYLLERNVPRPIK